MQFRYLAFTAVSLAAADPARADCTTSTSSGTTTVACTDTVTTTTTNSNQNNPGTTAYIHFLPTTIQATLAAGTDITGRGLSFWADAANPITVTNNGTIANTANETVNGQPSHGMALYGAGGLLTYLGSGSVTSNAAPPELTAGLYLTNSNGGGINIGSAMAPISGTFSGETALLARAPSGSFINAWINGGTFTATTTAGDAIEVNGLGNVAVTMTGQSTLNGSLRVGVYSNAPGASVVSLITDAHITETLGPAVLISGVSGGTSATIKSGAQITGQATGISVFSQGGTMNFTMEAGSTIHATSTLGAIGVQLQPGGAGSATASIAGAITSVSAGLFLAPTDGNIDITIQSTGSVSGDGSGISIMRLPGNTGVIDILNLGTISSPLVAANVDGILRIGNGGTTGTISGDIVNDGSVIFNRSNDLAYGQVISGTGSVTKLGAGTLTLGGANTYTGGTTVTAGTLLVNGSLTGNTTVAAGAGIGGTGSIGSTTINGGNLTPGGNGAIGTLTINGNLVLGQGSTYTANIGSGTADKVTVTGTASLAGTLALLGVGNVFTAGNHTLLTANGGISGTFNPITTQPTLAPQVAQVTYDANNVFLSIVPGTTATTSFDATLQFVPNVTTINNTAFSTRILGRLMGGTPLYDQTFAVPFANAQAQAGVTAARAAITAAGGPGVIIGDPVRTSQTVTSSTVQGPSTYSLLSDNTTVTMIETIGPAQIQIGDLSGCAAALNTLPSGTRPVCTPNPQNFTVQSVSSNIDFRTSGTYSISETRTDTFTTTTAETWELNGTVVSIGSIHAAVQSGLFDQGGRLLRRLGEQGAGGWGEFYAMSVDHGDQRETRGVAGGFGIEVAPGVTLGAGLDHGWIDIDAPGAVEGAELQLTEIGATARIDSGGFSAAVSGVYGFGQADTLRTIIGSSAASYDVRLSGAALELGYLIESGGWQIRPVAGLDHVSIATDGFGESDTLGLVAPDHDAERTRASAGLELGRDFGGVRLAASGRYLAVLDGEERTLPVAFALAPGTPLVMQGPAEGDSALVAARATIPLMPGATAVLGYDGRFGGGYESHGGFAGINVAF